MDFFTNIATNILAKDLACVSVLVLNTLLYEIILLITLYSFWENLWLLLKHLLDLHNFGSFQSGGYNVYIHLHFS